MYTSSILLYTNLQKTLKTIKRYKCNLYIKKNLSSMLLGSIWEYATSLCIDCMYISS